MGYFPRKSWKQEIHISGERKRERKEEKEDNKRKNGKKTRCPNLMG